LNETLKSYLVSLGFQVNNAEFNKMSQALTDMTKLVQTTTDSMLKSFTVASVGIAGVMMTTTAAIAGMIDKVAQLDLEYQKLALHMYTSTENAKQFKIVTSAMGENINDIAWVPELSQRYTALMQQSKQMETPGDAEAGVKKVRDIRFEFTRMKVEIMYGLQWIEYYLIKYLGGPLDIIENKLKSVNDWLTKNMPTWSEKVAGWITMFIQFTTSITRLCSDTVDALESVWKSIGGSGQALVKLASLAAFCYSNPIIAFFIAAGLAVDDFYAYIDGRKSSKTLAPIWKQLIDWFKELKPYLLEFGAWFNNFSNITIKALVSVLTGLWSILKSIFSEIGKSLEKSGVFTAFRDTLGKVGDALDSIMRGLVQLGKDIISKYYIC
jgi:hypothetical protein